MEKEDNISFLRQEYIKGKLSRNELKLNPFEMLNEWVNDAIKSKVEEPTAMNLATVDKNGHPSSRIVLLKELTSETLCFFSNYESKKAVQLQDNPNAAINFFWPAIERQVRIEGVVSYCEPVLSDEYFSSRPFESKVGAWASPQSAIIENREFLTNRFDAYAIQFKNVNDVPRPANWGGFQMKPQLFEFWQGRPGRLHDRFQYTLNNSQWVINRLAP